MPARIAYWIPDAPSEQDALMGPRTARLRRSLPLRGVEPSDSLMAQKHPTGGGQLLVWPRYDGAAVSLDAFGPPRQTPEGWTYYPSREAFDLVTLIKPEAQRPDGVWITTGTGIDLWIAVAEKSQRALIIRADATFDLGGYTTDFGRLAHEVYDAYFSKDGIGEGDRWKIARLIQLAVQQSYYATEELFEDLSAEWLTTRDVRLLMAGLMGIDPKDYAAAFAPSASSTPVEV